jgi:hypothetical protein
MTRVRVFFIFLLWGVIAPLFAHDVLLPRPLSSSEAKPFFLRAKTQWENGGCLRLEANGEEILLCGNGSHVTMKWKNEEKEILPDMGDIFTPLSTDSILTPFDFLFPFFTWKTVAYIGIEKLRGRSCHRFHLSPTDEGKIANVHLWLDGKFAYPVGWDAFDSEGRIWHRFRLRSLAKNNRGEWVPRRMEISKPADRQTVILRYLDETFVLDCT